MVIRRLIVVIFKLGVSGVLIVGNDFENLIFVNIKFIIIGVNEEVIEFVKEKIVLIIFDI